ncbi:MAG: 1-acyl-sn-glycerol-3-phosphate acyltransferase [Myxococcales bacterium]|nr:1-acyl-sn-glycerol-3-phosphate acyltransferase [Myxococcales bacterium]
MPSTGDETGLGAGLARGEEARLRRQIRIGRWLSPFWVPLAVAVMRWGFGWRVENAAELREAYRRLRSESSAPLLICANHLTLVDSFLVAWALGSPGFYLRHYDALPWNLPETTNFATTLWSRAGVYLMKSVPIRRGGAREEVAATLDRFAWLLRRGEVGLVFPEGGRSRTGRVDPESSAYGVGRVVKAIPECRVLCVYLRGEKQENWSALPVRGDRFRGAIAMVEPKSDRSGLRASLEISRQIVAKLADLERDHFDR